VKYIFSIREGPTAFLQERRGNVGRDQRIHTALRLIGLLLLRGRDPQMEPVRGVHHRKYTPDVISGDGKVWVEAGKVSTAKLADLAGSGDLERIIVVQADRKAAGLNAERLAQSRRVREIKTPVAFHGWRPDDISAISRLIRRRNEIEVHEEGDGFLDFTINGERLRMTRSVWEVEGRQARCLTRAGEG
jgi:hypothetical protein